MHKAPPPTKEQKWVGIDLHVHTPASEDYQGPRERSEYIQILNRANEFEEAGIAIGKVRTKRGTRPIKCVAFTDHNSVDGFREWRSLYDESVSLAEAVRDRDPGNTLLHRLDEDLGVLRSVRVLMGVEVNAYPGVHLLLIFQESVEAEAVEAFLEGVYGKQYKEIAGKPGPVTSVQIEELMERVYSTFGDRAMVIAPHVESGGGLLETLKDLHQVLMPVVRHSALAALSFNKSETRDRVRQMLTQPHYARVKPLALIQSSDAHGSRGAVGQPRTEVRITGQPTFAAIREAFNAGRLKCSIDFVSEEYDHLIEGQAVRKFAGLQGDFAFRPEDEAGLVEFVCATLNSGGGVVQLDLTLASHQELSQFYPEPLLEQVSKSLKAGLDPASVPLLSRALAFSANRVRVLFKPVPLGRIYTAGGIVYVLDKGSARPARSTEIEIRAAEVIESRFGERFHKTLSRVSEDSMLLSKVPEGIPLYLRSREHLSFFSVKDVGVTKIESTAARGREISEDSRQLYSEKTKESPFGLAKGNTSFLQRVDIRFEEHYTRYCCFTADVSKDVADRLSSARIEKPSIAVASGGAALLCDPGYIIANAPAVLIDLPTKLQKHSDACLGWLKSSFFIWYLAVHLSQKDLYQLLQSPDVRLPFPDLTEGDFYQRVGGLVRNVVLEERRFLDDLQRQIGRGADRRQREKLRTRHNNTLNGICLTIDSEVNKALGLRSDEVEFISRSIADMGLTDFGMLEQIESEREDSENDDSEGGE